MIPPVDPRLPLGERIARLALDLLGPGALSPAHRPDLASELMACGVPADRALYTLHSTCGVFARALRYWAGGPTLASAMGGQLVGSGRTARAWTAPLDARHASWRPWADGAEPTPGALFLVSPLPWETSKRGHVGTWVRPLGSDLWETAEGGGGPHPSTLCRLTTRRVARAQGGTTAAPRVLVGWWDLSAVPASDPPGSPPAPVPDTLPAPPPSVRVPQPSQNPGEFPPTLRRGAQGPAVRELQAGIGLPVGARDGVFGAGTEAGLRDWQRAHGLAVDGVAGRSTWEAIRARR